MKERTIFLAALDEGTPAQRSAYLDEACGGDAALRRRVEGLLASHEQAGSFLAKPVPERLAENRATPATGAEPQGGPPGGGADESLAPGPLTTLDESPLPERPGAVVGPYRLLQVIGEGGMGTVFMAEQTKPVQRKVALKIIKAGMDSAQVIARFEAERQALALMDHPNIARVIDAGTTEGGQPYFVMELVKGVPLTKYCDDHNLTPRQRLELFQGVCSAVQHAHQKGVIHRDLKPSNVLVASYDDRPVPKVIDFGVAKSTGHKLTERTMFTEFGQLVGTLEYMSPEQASFNSLDVDTRSDVYSLGVLLYELLAGSTPFEKTRLHEVAFDEVLRIIREEEPPRPSTRLSTTQELPAIATHRKMEPRKLGRLVRGDLDWIVMKALEKDRTRRYETASAFAADVQRYLSDEPVQACPPSSWYRFRKFARRNRRALAGVALLGAVLVAAVVGLTISNWRIDRERAQTAEANARLNANLSLATQTLDEVYLKVGQWAPRDPQRKKEYHELLGKMLGFYEQLAAQPGTDPHVRVNLAHYHVKFANLLVSGDRPAAEAHYRRALDLLTEVVADSPGEDVHQDGVAFVLFHLADLLHQAGRTAEAAEYYTQGFRIIEQKVSESSKLYGDRGPLVAAYYRFLAWNRATCPDPRFRDPARAIQAGQQAAAVEPSDVSAWKSVGIAHYRAGEMKDAVAALEKAMSRGSHTEDRLFLAMAHWRLGDKDKARQWYDRATRRAPGGPTAFPVRYAGFRAEATALFGVDKDQERPDGTGAPAKR